MDSSYIGVYFALACLVSGRQSLFSQNRWAVELKSWEALE